MYTFIVTFAMSSSNAAAIQEKLNAPAPEYPAFEDSECCRHLSQTL